MGYILVLNGIKMGKAEKAKILIYTSDWTDKAVLKLDKLR